MPSLKFRIALPIPRPRPGRRFAPKITMTMARVMTSSGSPIRPMVKLLPQATVPPRPGLFPVVFLMFLACAGIRAARGQFVSGVDLVEVDATVTDAGGQPVTGLTAGDLRVEDEG